MTSRSTMPSSSPGPWPGTMNSLRDEDSPPLEADAPDWQEQHQAVEDAGEDDFR